MECRQKQDRINDLLLKVNQEHSGVRRALRFQKAAIEIAEKGRQSDELKTQLRDLEDQDDDLRYLGEIVKAKQSNLRMTSSDLRLLCSIVDQRIKLGEIRPSRHGGKAETSPAKPEVQKPPATRESQVPVEAKPEVIVPEVQVPIASSEPIVDTGQDPDVLSIDAFLTAPIEEAIRT